MIREITEPKPHARLKAALIGVGSVAAMLVALIVLSPYLFPQDARPSFGDQRIDDQAYLVGREIEVKLPVAKRGNGRTIYALYPTVPGLTLSGSKLHGIPAEPGRYSMIYTVVDSDGDKSKGDKDWLMFTIIVQSSRSEGIIEGVGEEINAVDDDGTALCKAARFAGYDEVKMLLDRGADPNIYYRDRLETHPISCALANRKPRTEIRRILQALAEGGAAIPRDGVAVPDTSRMGPEDLLSLLSGFFR